ncbi:hypothetical protein CMV_017214, partial [Castanea mollissima]
AIFLYIWLSFGDKRTGSTKKNQIKVVTENYQTPFTQLDNLDIKFRFTQLQNRPKYEYKDIGKGRFGGLFIISSASISVFLLYSIRVYQEEYAFQGTKTMDIELRKYLMVWKCWST